MIDQSIDDEDVRALLHALLEVSKDAPGLPIASGIKRMCARKILMPALQFLEVEGLHML